MIPILAARAAKLVMRSKEVGNKGAGSGSSGSNGSTAGPKSLKGLQRSVMGGLKKGLRRAYGKQSNTVPVPSRAILIALTEQASHGLSLGIMWGSYMKVSIKVALTWHSVVPINLQHVDTPLGIMEGTINSMMTKLREAVYPCVVSAMIFSLIFFDDSMNPKLEAGKTWRGMMALPFYAISLIVLMVINGVSAYIVVWSAIMGDSLKYPASYDEETGEIQMKSAGDVTGFHTKIVPKIGCTLSAMAFACQIAVLVFRMSCSVRREKAGAPSLA